MAEVAKIQIEVDARQAKPATRALNALGVEANEVGKQTSRMGREMKQAETQTERLSKTSVKLRRMLGLLSAGLGGLTFVGLARQVGQATTQLNNIEATMRVATGSARAAGNQIAFIREESQRLGLFFPTVAKQMAQFSAAARSSSITGEELKTIFTGIAEASRAMGLTAPQAEGAMQALQQMMSKGKVSAEELRQQLGERMPGSIQIMASSLDVTTSKLFEMMENGELLSDEVLPKFGRELQKVFGTEASQQADKIAASVDRLRTSFFNLLSQDEGLPGAASAFNDIAEIIGDKSFQQSFDQIVQEVSELFRVILDNIDILYELAKVLGTAFIAGAALRLTKTLAGLVSGLNSAIGTMVPTTTATVALTGALNTLSLTISRIAWPVAIATAAGSAMMAFKDRTVEAKREARDLSIQIESLNKGLRDNTLASLDSARALARPDFQEFIGISEQIAAKQREIREIQADDSFIQFGPSVADIKEEILALENQRDEFLKNTMHYRNLTIEIEERREALRRQAEEQEAAAERERKNREEINKLIEEGTSLISDIPEVDLLPPGQRDRIAKGNAELQRARNFLDKIDDSANNVKDSVDEITEAEERFRSVADSIEGEFSDAFYNIFDDGLNAFDDLAGGILDIFKRTLADMAAQAIRNQIVIPITQQIVGGAGGILSNVTGMFGGSGGGMPFGVRPSAFGANTIGQTIQGAGNILFTPGVSSTAPISGAQANAMGAAAPASMGGTSINPVGNAAQFGNLAYMGAGLGGQFVGQEIGGQMGGTLGGAGATIGMAMGGPLGAVAGSVIGGLAGGALGGDSAMEEAIAKQAEAIKKREAETLRIIEQNTELSDAERERKKAARRERELAEALSEGNKARLRNLYAIQDYAEKLQELNRINEERNNLERRYLRAIDDTAALRQLELDATEKANRGILSFIFGLEDAAEKVQETEQNARQAFRLLQDSIRREQDALEDRLSGPIEALESALSALEGRRVTRDPRIARERALSRLRSAREEGVDTLSQKSLEQALDVIAEPSTQLFSSFIDYQRDFIQTRDLVRSLRDNASNRFETEMQALTAQLDQGQKQLNALLGIDSRVLSVEQAMNNLSNAIASAESAQATFEEMSAPGAAPSFEPRPTPPSTLRPGQTDDPTWERILGQAYQAHINQFGVDWFSSRTSEQERQAQLARMQSQYMSIKGFADGGMHAGGMRIVGERGPELEMTGPSRIMSNNDTRKVMGTDEMLAELQTLREEIAQMRSESGQTQYQIARNTKRTRDTLEKFDIDGLPPERQTT